MIVIVNGPVYLELIWDNGGLSWLNYNVRGIIEWRSNNLKKWLNDLIKPNLENLVGLSPTMGPLERYERSYIVTDNLTKEIMKKIQEIE